MARLLFFSEKHKITKRRTLPVPCTQPCYDIQKMRSGINNIKAAPHLKNIFRRVITAETQTSPAILPLLLHLQTCLQPHRS